MKSNLKTYTTSLIFLFVIVIVVLFLLLYKASNDTEIIKKEYEYKLKELRIKSINDSISIISLIKQTDSLTLYIKSQEKTDEERNRIENNKYTYVFSKEIISPDGTITREQQTLNLDKSILNQDKINKTKNIDVSLHDFASTSDSTFIKKNRDSTFIEIKDKNVKIDSSYKKTNTKDVFSWDIKFGVDVYQKNKNLNLNTTIKYNFYRQFFIGGGVFYKGSFNELNNKVNYNYQMFVGINLL